MDDEQMRCQVARFDLAVEDAKRYFGAWDMADPVVRAILHLVTTQNDFAHAMNEDACHGSDTTARMVESAIGERAAAVASLLEAFKREPRGFQ